MVDRGDLAAVVAGCDRYWRDTGVPAEAIAEMRLELEQHLEEAVADGRSVEDVIGSDPAAFAEAWAAEWRTGGPGGTPPAGATGGGGGRSFTWAYVIGGIALVAGVVVGATLTGSDSGGSSVDDGMWQWLWTIAALVMGIGEIFTAGFFLLPFAIGAAGAAILAWLGINLIAQWLVFFALSMISFAYLRRYIRRQDEQEQPRVGANRLLHAEGLTLEPVDPVAGTGMVRIENEEWRATTDGAPIPAGTWVRVDEVRGTRMVVSPKS